MGQLNQMLPQVLVLGLIVPKRHSLEQDNLAKLTATLSSALEKGETFRCISCQASQKKPAALLDILQLHVPQCAFPAFVFPKVCRFGGKWVEIASVLLQLSV